MAPDDDDNDRKVKNLPLDAATQADLARWFGLPSFTQVEEEAAKAPEQVSPDLAPAVAAVIERRNEAVEAVDKTLLEAIYARHDVDPKDLFVFQQEIDIQIDENFGAIDQELVAKTSSIAEPREVELPDALIDALKECTPQALLRDLHRTERYFDKTFEVHDALEEARVDASAEAKTAMTTHWKIPAREEPAFHAAMRVWQQIKAEQRRPWTELLPSLPSRRVSE
jgi:hypothetical protein